MASIYSVLHAQWRHNGLKRTGNVQEKPALGNYPKGFRQMGLACHPFMYSGEIETSQRQHFRSIT